mmetsp:Transcript_17667/g.25502  ORF Transcript_17667/g.25502 Transcript_17667/m.25502 type:complete len:83 (-) Transcript_17667:342-590(-)
MYVCDKIGIYHLSNVSVLPRKLKYKDWPASCNFTCLYFLTARGQETSPAHQAYRSERPASLADVFIRVAALVMLATTLQRAF